MSVLLVVVVVGVAMSIAMLPSLAGSSAVFLAPAVPYLVLTVAAIVRMHRDGTLAAKMRPRSGDLTFGAIVTVLLFVGAIAGRMLLAPHGSAREEMHRIAALE